MNANEGKPFAGTIKKLNRESGGGLVEYVLLAALISIVVISAVRSFGESIAVGSDDYSFKASAEKIAGSGFIVPTPTPGP